MLAPISATTEDDPSLYFEPLLRTFILGFSSGIACEVLHVAFKVRFRASAW